jgi:hypothetical protein
VGWEATILLKKVNNCKSTETVSSKAFRAQVDPAEDKKRALMTVFRGYDKGKLLQVWYEPLF